MEILQGLIHRQERGRRIAGGVGQVRFAAAGEDGLLRQERLLRGTRKDFQILVSEQAHGANQDAGISVEKRADVAVDGEVHRHLALSAFDGNAFDVADVHAVHAHRGADLQPLAVVEVRAEHRARREDSHAFVQIHDGDEEPS